MMEHSSAAVKERSGKEEAGAKMVAAVRAHVQNEDRFRRFTRIYEDFAGGYITLNLFFLYAVDLFKEEEHPGVWKALIAYKPRGYSFWKSVYCASMQLVQAKYPKHFERFRELLYLKETKRINASDFLWSVHSDMSVHVMWTTPMPWVAFPALWTILRRYVPTNGWKQRMRAKEAKKERRMVAVRAPFRNSDFLDVVLEYLTLPSLGRLASTCMWMRAHIKPKTFFDARERALLTHGKFGVVDDGGVKKFEVRNAEGDAILVRTMNETHNQDLRVTIGGVPYLASRVYESRLSSDLRSALSLDEAGRANLSMWFRFDKTDKDGLLVIKITYCRRVGDEKFPYTSTNAFRCAKIAA